MKHYFEFKDSKSNKFWEITLEGNLLVTRYGKIGAQGQTTTKSFSSEAEAKKEYNALIREKTKKGYKELRVDEALGRELPSILLPYRDAMVATIKPYVAIVAKKKKKLSLWQSKFGGSPYLVKETPYPTDENGEPMVLLAQINFAEIPKLEAFPEAGILQFYIAGNDEVYGINFDEQTKQENFKVLYFPDVVEDEGKLITDFDFLPEFEMLPFEDSCELKFALRSSPISALDFQFAEKVIGQGEPASNELDSKIYDEYLDLFDPTGHKLGGYPYFTQTDPRDGKKYTDYVLLFQMDTDDDADIMWGDCGVANFFIREENLLKRDFSDILYNWDCC